MKKQFPKLEKAVDIIDKTAVSATFKLLECLAVMGEIFHDPYEDIHRAKRERELRAQHFSKKSYHTTVTRCAKNGWIKKSQKNGELFMKLTKKGKLQLLLQRLRNGQFQQKPRSSNGTWWLVTFDIPEASTLQRYFIRRFLRDIRFIQLQKSVYISSYPIPKEAFDYLEGSKLRGFLRFMQVTNIDNEQSLTKRFKLEHP